MSSPAHRWRAPVTGAVAAALAAAAIVGPSALASGGGATPPRHAAKAARASGTASTAGTECGAPAGAKRAGGSSADPGAAPFLAAVAQLVQAGTINQTQADVLDAGIRSGSIDDSKLVANGTLSAAQMQAVDSRLIAVKKSLAPPPTAGTDCGQQAGAKDQSGSSPAPGPGPAPFLAAVQQLVQAGTINQSQANVLDAGIRAGSIDDSKLVADGTLSAAQMHAVDDRLMAVKRSLAPAAERGQVAKAAADRKKSQH